MANKNYFSDKELSCPCCGGNDFSPELLETLNRMREMLMRPLILNSAYRCESHDLDIYLKKLLNKYRGWYKEEYNKLVEQEKAKKRTSSHIKGLAADLSVAESTQRFKVYDIARECGINRIGIEKSFIHIDIDLDKVQNVQWLY